MPEAEKSMDSTAKHTAPYSSCLEVTWVTFTHTRLSPASHIVTSNFKWVGKCNSTICLESKRTKTFLKSPNDYHREWTVKVISIIGTCCSWSLIHWLDVLSNGLCNILGNVRSWLKSQVNIQNLTQISRHSKKDEIGDLGSNPGYATY